jgi:hypothetical protein
MLYNIFSRFFNFKRLVKIIIIFFTGFFGRIFIYEIFDVNVINEYLHPISLSFYLIFASFVVLVHDYFDYLPSFSRVLSVNYSYLVFFFTKFSLFDFDFFAVIRFMKFVLYGLFFDEARIILNVDQSSDKFFVEDVDELTLSKKGHSSGHHKGDSIDEGSSRHKSSSKHSSRHGNSSRFEDSSRTRHEGSSRQASSSKHLSSRYVDSIQDSSSRSKSNVISKSNIDSNNVVSSGSKSSPTLRRSKGLNNLLGSQWNEQPTQKLSPAQQMYGQNSHQSVHSTLPTVIDSPVSTSGTITMGYRPSGNSLVGYSYDSNNDHRNTVSTVYPDLTNVIPAPLSIPVRYAPLSEYSTTSSVPVQPAYSSVYSTVSVQPAPSLVSAYPRSVQFNTNILPTPSNLSEVGHVQPEINILRTPSVSNSNVNITYNDLPLPPRPSNLSTPSNLSSPDPNLFPELPISAPSAPRPSNLSTPSNLSSADPNFFPELPTSLPSAPRPSNLSTPSNLSSPNSNLFSFPRSSSPDSNFFYFPRNSYLTPNGVIVPSGIQVNESPAATQSNFTNDTAHATVGDRSPWYLDEFHPAVVDQLIRTPQRPSPPLLDQSHEARRALELEKTMRRIDPLGISIPQELTLSTGKGKFKLGINFLDNTLNTLDRVYIKYTNMAKTNMAWKIWYKHRGDYSSFEEFKQEFDPKTKVLKEILKSTKHDVRQEVVDLLKDNPFHRARIEASNRGQLGNFRTGRQEDFSTVKSKTNPTGTGRGTGTATGVTKTQDQLNNLAANRYNAQPIEHSKIKHKHVNRHGHGHGHRDRH